ncbi:IucA/IucC family protein [Bacillus sp. ISL-45]|uniref:IucA/IucC family protein n=1 Tax=Bacillus sp. ISL-45 TaxID=2819128 RepID=UPI001BE86D72|nr:IucA/IucC family protein [Bacillus sp. ISL-45]MBT2662820.1 IucA/IucC family siderophore biosynthesis protein [Bacillus sp. ISL-45]
MTAFDDYILLFPIKKEYAFNRLILEGDILLIGKDWNRTVETASELLRLIGLEQNNNDLGRELDNGTANITMAYVRHDSWSKKLKDEGEALKVSTILQYALAKKAMQPEWSSLLLFEQLALEGHHLHPGTKTKTGMSPLDVARYSPEFHEEFPICFAAVHKDYLLSTEITQNTIERLFPIQNRKCREILSGKGLNPSNYQLLPVHEWQFKHTLTSMYGAEIERKIIVPLPSIKDMGAATSSFRTLLPSTKNCFIKLAVNSQMTSTVRSISTNTAMNSTAFSCMLNEILRREQHLDNFLPLNETAGFAFTSNDNDLARNLTVVIRENKENELAQDEIPIVGSCLYNSSPFTNKTVLEEIIEEYNQHHQLSKKAGVISFLNDYLSITVPGFLTLMTKYGVALEGHLQNSIPVFKHGKPVRFFFRDWGGARIYIKRLESCGLDLKFHPGSMTLTDDRNEMYAKAHYTIFQSHFGEIIRLLTEISGVNERIFWREVKRACDEVFSSLSFEVEESVKEDQAYFFQDKVKHKALASMRITKADNYMYSTVANPLGKNNQS